MDKQLKYHLRWLTKSDYKMLLKGGKKGLEKESLRITPKGSIAQTSHPQSLGSALTHPYITTDYSEALLEFVTPPCEQVEQTLDFLTHTHQFTYTNLNDEMLWAASMPCAVTDEKEIPIAYYGTSNVGQMKHVYRRGLGYRYGREMQIIAGIHFNYSLPESFWPILQAQNHSQLPLAHFINKRYIHLLRNFHRLGWIISYLFGASPAVCQCFLKTPHKGFIHFDSSTYTLPYATSLRMSDIGYKNDTQAGVDIPYNNLSEYIEGLTKAIETPFPPYEKIGVEVDGSYRQLNANVLQIENEFYSFIRPKQITQSGEKPTLALKRRGVQYIEVRALDINPYEPLGVNQHQLYFLEAFLILCLLKASPNLDSNQRKEAEHNQRKVACCGRDPVLNLQQNGENTLLKTWALEIYQEMEEICSLLDQGLEDQPYTTALTQQYPLIEDPDLTPSAQILAEMKKTGRTFYRLAIDLSQQHANYFKEIPFSQDKMEYFTQLAQTSWQKQRHMEATDTLSFKEYLAHYLAQK
ncbi:glutamate--cysteine ligase [Candidatus Nitrosacidococcus sp. I8]|uniref:glutamate--cysteine ligase n=1 Tax=Candidatus Nitrosacidococcus sp. I8 TaxID=2942908 RepID=UPI00222712A4|nr:glutamate--cysteine ligase [Candidatus Nitrosacidococcus sp. I8]CAH9018584.1 Glutamate--cysteine ligase [Candidatus Nitrosacidococcus sp. I8]